MQLSSGISITSYYFCTDFCSLSVFYISGNLPKHHLGMLIEMAYLKTPALSNYPISRAAPHQTRNSLELLFSHLNEFTILWQSDLAVLHLCSWGQAVGPLCSLRAQWGRAPCWDRHRASIPSAIATTARAVPEHSPAGREIHRPVAATDWIPPFFLSWASAAVPWAAMCSELAADRRTRSHLCRAVCVQSTATFCLYLQQWDGTMQEQSERNVSVIFTGTLGSAASWMWISVLSSLFIHGNLFIYFQEIVELQEASSDFSFPP